MVLLWRDRESRLVELRQAVKGRVLRYSLTAYLLKIGLTPRRRRRYWLQGGYDNDSCAPMS